MNPFPGLRFKKTLITLTAIGVLVFIAIPIRALLGASFGVGESSNFSVISILVLFLYMVILWLVFRKKGIQPYDLFLPTLVLYLIVLMLHYHITQIS